MNTNKTPARLDADRTAQPLTRIVHHPPREGCIGPYMPLVAPEYEDEHGKRTPLDAPATAPHDLTDSEVALARIFAAWDAWGVEDDGPVAAALFEVGPLLHRHGWAIGRHLSPQAAALLDRARKAGVL